MTPLAATGKLTPSSRLNPVEPHVSRPPRPQPAGLDSLRGAGQLRMNLEILASYHADYAPDPLATRICATYISRCLRCADAPPARKRPHAPSSAASLPPPTRTAYSAEGQNYPILFYLLAANLCRGVFAGAATANT